MAEASGNRADVRHREFFCDALTWRSAIVLARSGVDTVRVLDDLPPRVTTRVLRRILALLGCRVVETDFFAGHLRGAGGEPLFAIAARRTSELALEAARDEIAARPELAAIDAAAGRNRLTLRLARQHWLTLGRQVVQIHVVQALAAGHDAMVWLARPTRYDPRVLQSVLSAVEVHHYTGTNAWLERLRLLGWIASLAGRGAYWRIASRCARAPGRLRDPRGRPGLLLVQEDEVSTDRSYRTQPHWFPPADASPLPFATYLIAGRPWPPPAPSSTPEDLTVLTERTLGFIDRCAAPDPVSAGLRAQARLCAWRALLAPRDHARAAYAMTARLLLRTALLARACAFLDIRAFLSGEPYLLDSDAVHAISGPMDVTTLTFQYSNLAYGNVIAAVSSERMLLFSERFASIWAHRGFSARQHSATGYPFDGAFARVRDRALQLRRRLENAGARFVVCFFDENVGPPKYGFFAPSDLDGEIRTLARHVLDDPSLAVVFKSQFRKRSPTVRLAADPVLHAALDTGRMIDLHAGAHRNVVLPAEAALAADITLSHLIGGTAALESALAGTRSLLINFNGLKTANDPLYARGQVVFDSFDAALDAIARFRAGSPDDQGLGDWSAFLHELDPFRDGRSAERLREHIASAIGRGRRVQPPLRQPEAIEG